jgi:hypothetical protein
MNKSKQDLAAKKARDTRKLRYRDKQEKAERARVPEYDGRFERERQEESEANAKFLTPLEQAYGDSDDPTIP